MLSTPDSPIWLFFNINLLGPRSNASKKPEALVCEKPLETSFTVLILLICLIESERILAYFSSKVW
jgi:hypothetical protein